MQKLIYILIVILLIFTGFMLFSLFGGSDEQPETYTELDFEPLPENTPRPDEQGVPEATTLELVDRNGETLRVNNFIADGTTVEDKMNSGTYVLAGDQGYCPEGVRECGPVASVTDYFIAFSSESQVFHVGLFTEPIAETRKEAEEMLMQRLGIGENEMCKLRATVRVPYYVNNFYAGQELRFSFCSNSVQLE